MVDVALADRAYLPWCATAILSCLRATGADVVVHVLHGGDVTADDERRLAAMSDAAGGALVTHVVDASAVAMAPSKGVAEGGRVSWLRIALASTLPSLSRVVYLDGDVLVRRSIEPLWDLDLDGAPIAGVRNVVEPAMRPHVADLGVGDGEYRNAGVLVIDLDRWRADDATTALACFAEARAGSIPWFDQDALNAVFAGRWATLDPTWNAQSSFWVWRGWAVELLGERAVDEATADPAIVHFEGPGPNKPWHVLCRHPYRQQYLDVLADTPWAGTAMVGRTWSTRAIRVLPGRWWLPAYVTEQRARRAVATRLDARRRR